jgi:hypothetical protein
LDSEVDGNDRLVSQCPPGMTGARSRPREAARSEAGALLCFFSLHSSERGQQQDRHARQGWHAALFLFFESSLWKLSLVTASHHHRPPYESCLPERIVSGRLIFHVDGLAV